MCGVGGVGGCAGLSLEFQERVAGDQPRPRSRRVWRPFPARVKAEKGSYPRRSDSTSLKIENEKFSKTLVLLYYFELCSILGNG